MGRDPRYLLMADALRDLLTSGEYPPGRLLPSEADLAASYQVSRATVRKALGQLKRAGLVHSRQGFGWYAVSAPLRQSLESLMTIEAQIVTAGRSSGRRVLSFSFISPPPQAQEILEARTVLEITRLNLVDDQPFARVTVWVPEDLAADLSRRAVEQRPLYELLGLTLVGATQVISATAACQDDAELLQVPRGSPLLRCVRTTTDSSGRAVLLSDAVFNPLITEFIADLPAVAEGEASGLRLVQ